MHLRSVRRAAALALTGVLAFAGLAAADTALSDGDVVEPGTQTFVDLGVVAPSAVIEVEVAFELVCSNIRHADPGQTITLTRSGQAAPTGGAVLSATPATIGPVPATWPAEGADCPDPLPVLGSATSSIVTLRAPAVVNVGYMYTVAFSRSISPAGVNDSGALSGTSTGVSFRLAVAANTAPVLTVPTDMTVEGDTAGGRVAAYAATAIDAQDDPDPTPTCAPAAGAVLPLGTTTVSCTVTDAGGLTDVGSFDVTVVDTTAPSLAGVPGAVDVTTGSPAGVAVEWTSPTASDVVDTDPVVACAPASGSTFPVGTTTVTCTATDVSGNAAVASFAMRVAHVRVATALAVWHEPLPADGGTFVANRGRTIPVKVSLRVDGVAQTSGSASLRLVACGGGPASTIALGYSGGRWNASLDTSSLLGSCSDVTAVIDGLDAGRFRLELRGAETTKAKAIGRATGKASGGPR